LKEPSVETAKFFNAEIWVKTYWTTLEMPVHVIISLYRYPWYMRKVSQWDQVRAGSGAYTIRKYEINRLILHLVCFRITCLTIGQKKV